MHILALYLSLVLLTLSSTSLSLPTSVTWDEEGKKAAVRKAESTFLRVNLSMVLKILTSSLKIPIKYFACCLSKLCSGQFNISETRKHISE